MYCSQSSTSPVAISFAKTSANASAAAGLEDPNPGSERFFPQPVNNHRELILFCYIRSKIPKIRLKLDFGYIVLAFLPSNALQNGRFPR